MAPPQHPKKGPIHMWPAHWFTNSMWAHDPPWNCLFLPREREAKFTMDRGPAWGLYIGLRATYELAPSLRILRWGHCWAMLWPAKAYQDETHCRAPPPEWFPDIPKEDIQGSSCLVICQRFGGIDQFIGATLTMPPRQNMTSFSRRRGLQAFSWPGRSLVKGLS